MGEFLVFTPSKTEQNTVADVMLDLQKPYGNVRLPEKIGQVSALEQVPAETMLVLVSDVTASGILPVLERIRRENPELKLVVVADPSVSPMVYIRPTIQPVALMLRPLGAELARSTLSEVLRMLPDHRGREAEQDDSCFTVELRGNLQRIPYRDILYYEARNKRLILHLRRREIAFGGTLEKLEEELPPGFLRTHKSFIVNTGAVVEIQYGQNQVILDGEVAIPISRSYKPKVKAVFA